MFDRFTDRARKTMGLARQAALRYAHGHIGSEHLLLGLLDEGTGVAWAVLKNLSIDLDALRRDCEGRLSPGSHFDDRGQVPFTADAKATLEICLKEARELGHEYLGTEHILLGLIGLQEGVAAAALRNAGVTRDPARSEIRALIGESPTDRAGHDWMGGGGAEARESVGAPDSFAILFLRMLDQEDEVVPRALRSIGIDLETVREAVRREMGT